METSREEYDPSQFSNHYHVSLGSNPAVMNHDAPQHKYALVEIGINRFIISLAGKIYI